MMDIAHNDLVTMFKEAVVLYQGEPVKVMEISADCRFKIWDLKTQKMSIVDWDFKKFRNPTRRLGMVNVNSGVAYVSRIPHRKYSAGLNKGNLIINFLQGDRHTQAQAVQTEIRALEAVGIADSLNNAYPTFAEAYEWVRSFYGTYAFDKQFAVSTEGDIWYKTMHVGNVGAKAKDVKDIVFFAHAEHLAGLLDPSLELNRTH